MVLEFRMVSREFSVVVDSDRQGISLIVLKSVKVFLPPNLVHSDIGAVSVFEFYKQCRFLRIPWRGKINHIRIPLAGVKLQNRSVILPGRIIGQLDSIA